MMIDDFEIKPEGFVGLDTKRKKKPFPAGMLFIG